MTLYYAYKGRGRQNARRGAGMDFRALGTIPAGVAYRVSFWLDSAGGRWAGIEFSGKLLWVLTTLGKLEVR